MDVLTTIHRDLRNPKCEGIFLESDGNSITARRINDWQFDVTAENWKGREFSYYKVSPSEIEKLAQEFLMVDDHCTYIAHIPTAARWTPEKIDKFINSLCPTMCKPSFAGFTLTAEGTEPYTVLRHPNRMEWYVDGKVTDFTGVIRKTRAKLAEEFAWEYQEM